MYVCVLYVFLSFVSFVSLAVSRPISVQSLAVRQWRTHLRALSRPKADTLNTSLASSFIDGCLYGDTAICFSGWLQRLPAFIVYFRCLYVIIDFCPAVLYTVCAASHRKIVMRSICRLLTCHRLLKFVYKNLCFVRIYSKVIQRLYHNNIGVPVIMTHRAYML